MSLIIKHKLNVHVSALSAGTLHVNVNVEDKTYKE